MPYFVVHALDALDKVAERTSNRPAHRARLREHDHPVTVHIGGPLLDDAGVMCGTMLVVEAAKPADVEAYLAGDPYTLAGVYGSVAIHGYRWGLGQPEDDHG